MMLDKVYFSITYIFGYMYFVYGYFVTNAIQIKICKLGNDLYAKEVCP